MTTSMKKVISLLALLLILIGTFTGCKILEHENGDWYITSISHGDTEWALAELEKKYGEKFECSQNLGSSDLSTSTKFLASCDSCDDLVYARVDHTSEFSVGDDERVLYDNYVAVKYASEVCRWAQTFCDEVFEKSVVLYERVDTICLFTDYSPDTTFEEYISNENINLYLIVNIPESAYSDPEQFEASAKRLLNAFTGNELDVNFVVLPDDMVGSVNQYSSMSPPESCIASAHLYFVKKTQEPVLRMQQEGDQKWRIKVEWQAASSDD